MKLHTYHSLGMLYEWYKFGCDQSITRGTLLEEQRISMAESRLQFRWFFKLQFYLSLCMTFKLYRFGSDRSIMRSPLPGKRSMLSAISHHQSKKFLWN